MTSQAKTSTKSETPSTREANRAGRTASPRVPEERPWWSLGDWRSTIAEPEFVLA